MGKKLRIKCAFCDLSKATPERIAAYERIDVKAAMVIVNPAVQSCENLHIECAAVFTAENEVQVLNGGMTIDAGMRAPDRRTSLFLNGALTLMPGCEDALRNYDQIIVNGVYRAPKRLAPANLPFPVRVNGSSQLYDDDCVPHFEDIELTDRFLREAQPGPHRVFGRVRATRPLDTPPEGIALQADEAFVTEHNHALLAGTLRADAIVVVPDDHAIVDGGEPTEDRIARHGTRWYVDGSLLVLPDQVDALRMLDHAIVAGHATVPRAALLDMQQRCDEGTDIRTYRGALWRIQDEPDAVLTSMRLRYAPDGLTIHARDSEVTLDAALSEEDLARVHELSVVDSTLTLDEWQMCALGDRLRREDAQVCLRDRPSATRDPDGAPDEEPDDGGIEIKAAAYTFQ